MISTQQIKIKLAEAIKQSGLTQAEIARRTGVKQPQICCYVKGTKMPSLDTLANMCVALDLDANEILCVTENR